MIRTISLTSIVFLLGVGSASAGDNTWTDAAANLIWNTTSADWTSPTVWSNTNIDDAVFGTTGAGTITVSSAITVRALEFNVSGYTLGGTGTLTLTTGGTGNLTVGEIAVGSGLTATINAPIAGSVGLSLVGGTLTLGSTSNSYSGQTQVQGTLTLGASGVIPDASVVVLGSGSTAGTLQLNAKSETIGGLATSGTGASQVINNSTTLSTLTIAASGNNFAGVLGGTGTNNNNFAIAINGTGIQTFSGTNTYTGGTTLTSGELSVSSDSNLGGSTGSLKFSGGTLQVTGTSYTSTARTITWNAGGGGFDINSTLNAFTVNQNLTGGGPLTKLGNGTLILTGANTYTGGTTIAGGGVLVSGSAGALPSGSSLTIGQSASPSVGTFSTGSFSQTIGSLTIYGLSEPRNVVLVGTATLTLNGNISVLNTVASAGNAQAGAITGQAGGTLDLGGAVRNITLAGQANGGTAGDLTISVPITDGGINFTGNPSTFNGAPTGMTLGASTPNTYNGGTTVNAGTLNVASTTSLGTGGLSLNTTGAVASTVILNGSVSISYLSTGVLGAGAATVNLNGAGVTLSIAQLITTTYAGVISGSGSLVMNTAGNLTLSGANTYTGSTTVYGGGTLNAGAANALPSGTALILGQQLNGTSATVNTGGFAQTISSLTSYAPNTINGSTLNVGTGTLTLKGNITLSDNTSAPGDGFQTYIVATTGGTLDLGGLARNITVAGQNNVAGDLVIGAIITNGGINYTGNPSTFGAAAAVLTLQGSAPNTYNGGTTVNAGTLNAASPNCLGSVSSPLTLNTTGTVASTVIVSGSQNIGSLQTGTLGTGAATVMINTGGSLNLYQTTTTTFAGSITGPGELTMQFPGVLILTGNNTYTGGTQFVEGILQIGAGGTTGSLPSTGSINVELGNAGLVFDRSDSISFGGTMFGGGTLTQAGTGTLTLTGSANLTYQGGTFVTAGTLQLAPSGSELPSGRNVTVSSGATLNVGNTPDNVGSAIGTLTLNGGTLVATGNTSGGAYYVTQLVMTGGALNFTGAVLSTYDAGIIINASSTTALWSDPSGTSTVELSGPASTITVAAGSTSSGIDLDSQFSLQGTWTKAGTGVMRMATQVIQNMSLTVAGGALRIDAVQTFNNVTGSVSNDSLTLNGGTLQYGGPTVTTAANPLTIGSSNGTINVLNAATTLTLDNLISGSGGLTKTGPGTLILANTSNTFAGGFTVGNGAVFVAADGDLGTNFSPVTVNALGSLTYTGTTSTVRAFTLNFGTLNVAAGQTLTMNAASVGGGFMTGPGTFALTGGTVLGGVTTQPSAVINQTGSASYVNVTSGSTLTISPAQTATMTGFTNQGSGAITVGAGSAVNAADFQTYGMLNLAPNTTAAPTILTNTGTTPLFFNGGSQTFIGTPATADPTGQNILDYVDLHGNNAIVAGGLFVNNGGIFDTGGAGTSTIIAEFGALVKGAGFYQNTVKTQNGGKFQTGNSPGSATFGNFVFGPGGVNNYVFAIDDATGTAGPSPGPSGLVSGWGLIKAVQVSLGAAMTSGNFTWTATPSNPLTVAIDTLVNPTTVGTDVAGPMADFDPNKSYSWTAARWTGTYAGPTDAATLDADTSFDASGIVNPIAGAFGWSLDAADQSLSLVYTPSSVPEPGTLALAGLAACGLIWRRRAIRGLSFPDCSSGSPRSWFFSAGP